MKKLTTPETVPTDWTDKDAEVVAQFQMDKHTGAEKPPVDIKRD